MLKARTRQEMLQDYDYVDKISLVQGMSDAHIRVLRDDIDDWEQLMPKLGLDEKEVELIDLQENRDVMKRHAALHKWKRKLGRRATYLCFLNACMKILDIALAERMLDLLNEHMKDLKENSSSITEYRTTSSRLHHDRPASLTDRDDEKDILSLSYTSVSSRDSSIGDWLPIEQRVEELKMKYKYTVAVITEYFEKVSSEKIAKCLLSIPAELKQLKAHRDVTKAEGTDSFSQLLSASDYRQVQILQHLVGSLGDDSCRRAMTLYQGDLNHFNCETTLGEFAKESQEAATPTGQNRITLKMGARWEKKTLQDFEELRKKLQNRAGCGANGLQMLRVRNPCVEITLAIVSQLADSGYSKLVEPELLNANHVLQVSLKNSIIYDVESPKRYEFVNDPPSYFICPIAKHIMLDPQKTKCCSRHVSMATILQCKENGDSCPFCHSANFEFREDTTFRDKINAIKIYCPYKHEGCHWEGEIRHASNHMQGSCLYSLIQCPYSCGASTQRLRTEQHLQTCIVYSTPIQCQYCGAQYLRNNSHEEVCPNIPIYCPYRCGMKVEQCKIKGHLKICSKLQTRSQKRQMLPEEHTDGCSTSDDTQQDDKNFRPAGYKLLEIAKKILPLRARLPNIQLNLLETRIHLTHIEVNRRSNNSSSELGSASEEQALALQKEEELQNEEEQVEREIAALRRELHQIHSKQY